LGRYYPPAYRGNRHSFTERFRVSRRAKAILDVLSPGRKGRLLDIGAGAGGFAAEMAARGWDVWATEFDEATCQSLRGRGVRALLPEEAHAKIPENLDVVTCWHVLEHAADPAEMLRLAWRKLRRDGILHVSVPNRECAQAKLGGRHWLHYDVPRHLIHFTPGSLEKLLHREGFRVIRVELGVLEYDAFGYVQTALNAMTDRPNVLFRWLTRAPGSTGASPWDMAITVAMGPALVVASGFATLAEMSLKAGATVTVTAVRKERREGWHS
jgi:SAM-dependent methyltransferase